MVNILLRKRKTWNIAWEKTHIRCSNNQHQHYLVRKLPPGDALVLMLSESGPPRKQEDWLTEEISAFYSLRKPELQVKLLTFSSDITLPTVSFVAAAAIATLSLAASSLSSLFTALPNRNCKAGENFSAFKRKILIYIKLHSLHHSLLANHTKQ